MKASEYRVMYMKGSSVEEIAAGFMNDMQFLANRRHISELAGIVRLAVETHRKWLAFIKNSEIPATDLKKFCDKNRTFIGEFGMGKIFREVLKEW